MTFRSVNSITSLNLSPLLVVLMTLTLALPTPSWADGKPIVAIFDIETRQITLKPAVLQVLWDTLAAQLAEHQRFQLVPRDTVRRRLRAQKRYSYRDCFARSCQIAIGRELAAKKTIATKITRIGGTCQVIVTLWDLKKATAEAASQVESKCSAASLLGAVKSTAQRLGRSAGSANRAATKARRAGKGSCTPGKVEVAGHCCWPGQDWGTTSERCVGDPKCPVGLLKVGADCRRACKAEHVDAACCWPGQIWSPSRKRCIGRPSSCPGGWTIAAEGCRAQCAGGRVQVGAHCCWPGQDWGAQSQRCVGQPRCPGEMVPKGNACVEGPADSAARIKAKLASISQRIDEGCPRRPNGWAIVHFTIDNLGIPRKVKVGGMYLGTRAGACIEGLVRRARFAERRAPISIKYPFHIKAR